MSATWWRDGFNVAMILSRLTVAYRGGVFAKYYGVAGFGFMLSKADAHGHGDQIEEQLYAIKHGYA